jgi:arsenate reductase
MPLPRVLFLCTGNSARSQMAEALLRKHGGQFYEVYSAGTEPKSIHPLTLQVMQEAGIDMSQQYSKALTEYMGKLHFGFLITVCDRAEKACPIFPGMGIRLHWPFEDPAAFEGTPAEKVDKFRQVRDQIEAKILAWLQETRAK